MSTPFRRHCVERGAVPVAVTVKVTMSPSHTVCDCGGTVIVRGSSTTNTAPLLVAVPQSFVTVTV